MNKIFDDLNTNQKEAVFSTEGPLLIIAGPGSGKTRVITYRFVYLIISGKALPSEILCITFTNKAAEEMRVRIAKITNLDQKEVEKLWIKTFHALGLRMLKEYYAFAGLNRDFVVYDSDDQLKLVKSIMKEYNYTSITPERSLETIQEMKEKSLGDISNLEDQYLVENFGELYQIYQRKLSENNAVDFTDLIVLPIKILRNNPKIRESFQKRWKYIMVDEFQDTNLSQYELIKLIINENRNICVVGDDDQSIYGWRGANVENIRNFDKDFKDCKLVFLDTNYRSTDEIINFSNIISNKMLFRREGKIIKGIGNKGSKPTIIEAYDIYREAQIVAKIIKNLVRDGYQYKDISVLYRANYLSRILEEEFIKFGIPYKIYGGIQFFERAEIKDILAYLKFSVNPRDFVSFSRIINTPKRSLGDSAVSKIVNVSDIQNVDLLEACYIFEKQEPKYSVGIRRFLDAIQILRDEKLSIADRVLKLVENIGYYDYLRTLEGDPEDRIDNVKELIVAIEDFESKGSGTISDFLDSAALVQPSDYINENNSVSLMTLHISKGLEFPVVFIYNVVDGVIPHSRSLNRLNELDEERRLFYVGVTRAKQKLFITLSKISRSFKGSVEYRSPSRFLDGISEKFIEYYKDYSNKFL